MSTPKKGEHYTHTDLGITYPLTLNSYVQYGGNRYLFVTIKNKDNNWQNELHNDGLVHEPGDPKHLVPYSPENDTKQQGMYIMVRYYSAGPYLCLGELNYQSRYDIKRNKLFIKDNTP